MTSPKCKVCAATHRQCLLRYKSPIGNSTHHQFSITLSISDKRVNSLRAPNLQRCSCTINVANHSRCCEGECVAVTARSLARHLECGLRRQGSTPPGRETPRRGQRAGAVQIPNYCAHCLRVRCVCGRIYEQQQGGEAASRESHKLESRVQIAALLPDLSGRWCSDSTAECGSAGAGLNPVRPTSRYRS